MEKAKVYKIESDCLQRGVIKKEDPMRGKISKAMVALIAAAFVLCFVSSCDLDGPTQYIYTVPTWLRGGYLMNEDAVAQARAEADVGQKYFVGVRATSNSILLLYRIKGTGTDDELVVLRQEEVPAMINHSYTAGPAVVWENENPAYVSIHAFDGTHAKASLYIYNYSPYLKFDFNPKGFGGFLILK